jgi:hypothetical protein
VTGGTTKHCRASHTKNKFHVARSCATSRDNNKIVSNRVVQRRATLGDMKFVLRVSTPYGYFDTWQRVDKTRVRVFSSLVFEVPMTNLCGHATARMQRHLVKWRRRERNKRSCRKDFGKKWRNVKKYDSVKSYSVCDLYVCSRGVGYLCMVHFISFCSAVWGPYKGANIAPRGKLFPLGGLFLLGASFVP